MKKNESMVSIIIPTYRGLDYIKKCSLRSVLNQTYQNFEILVGNDGKDTELKDYLKGLGDNRIKFFEFERPNYRTKKETWCVGGASSRNKCLDIAKGDYIAPLDQDEVWKYDFLEKKIKFLESNLNIDFVYSKAFFVGYAKKGRTLTIGKEIGVKEREEYIKDRKKNYIPHLSVVYRSKLKKYKYPEKGEIAADYVLWRHMIVDNIYTHFLNYIDCIHLGKFVDKNKIEDIYKSLFYKDFVKI